MKKILPTLVVAIGFSTAAFAQLPEFEVLDTDADGMISRTEASVIEGLDFDSADVNQDGSIDREEYGALGQE